MKLFRLIILVACLTASSCDAITGSDRPSFFLAVSTDSLPVFEEGSVVAVNAAGDTIQALVDEWTTGQNQVAVVWGTPDPSAQGRYAPAARIEARQVGVTTVSAEIDGERATAELTVVPPLVPDPPTVSATYFSRNHRVWVRWGPLDRARLFRIFRKHVDESEWTLIAEGTMADYHDFLAPGADPTALLYSADLCNESGCSGRGEPAAPHVGS